MERAVTVCAPFTNIQVFPFSPSLIFFWNHEKLRDARTLLGQFFDNPGIITHLGSQIDNSISLSKHVDWSTAFWGKITFLYPGCWGQTVREIRWKYSGNEKSEQPGYFSLDFRPQSRINLSDRISANPSYLSDCFQTWICNDHYSKVLSQPTTFESKYLEWVQMLVTVNVKAVKCQRKDFRKPFSSPDIV